jgi:biopolymer transport protein TolR
VLVLLIIFMVVTPMLTRGRDVQLPVAASTSDEADVPDAVVLTVAADHSVWIDNSKIEIGALTNELKRRQVDARGGQVLIKADSSVTVRDLRPVLELLKQGNITDIGFAVLEQRRGAK